MRCITEVQLTALNNFDLDSGQRISDGTDWAPVELLILSVCFT